jgi:RNA polymerase-binding transcription factor DksA
VADAAITPEPLTATERVRLRTDLIAERERAEERLTSLRRSIDELVDAADLEPPDDEHDPDGTTAYERAQVISLAQETSSVMDELDRALKAVDEPTFGTCAGCGGPIGFDRLSAVPTTTACVECAAAGRDPTH